MIIRWIGWEVDMKRKTEVDVYGKVRWELIEKVPIDGRREDQKFNRYGLTC